MLHDKTLTRQLRQAINEGDYFQAQSLLARGVDPDDGNLRGNTALHRAVVRGERAMIDLVLAYRPNLQARNLSGQTPGALAEYLGDRETAVRLGHPVPQRQRAFRF